MTLLTSLSSDLVSGVVSALAGGSGPPPGFIFASDSFDGTGGASGPAINTDRWTPEWTEGTASIVASKLRYVVDAGAPKLLGHTNEGDLTGDFEAIVNVSMTNFLADGGVGGTSQAANFRLHTSAGAFVGQIVMQKDGSDNDNVWGISVDSGGVATNNWASDSIWFRVTRVGTTIAFYYSSSNGSWIDTGFTLASSATLNIVMLGFSRWTGGNLTMEWDNLTIETPSTGGTEVLIPE